MICLAVDADFSFYPDGAQDCLEKSASNSDCSPGANVDKLNQCLCNNTRSFISNSAKCIEKESRGDLNETYDTMRDACKESNTPISLSRQGFLDAADGKSVSPTSSTATALAGMTTPPSAEESSHHDSSDRFSTTTTIGIAVGSSVVGACIVAGIGWWMFRRYRKRTESKTTLLPQHNEEMGGPSAYAGTSPSMLDSKSPPPTYENGWGSSAPEQQAMAPAELPPDNETRFEMEGSVLPHQEAAEMPGSTPRGTQQELQ